MDDATAALAALRDPDRRDPRPLRIKLDSGVSILAPSPLRLAEVYVLPRMKATHQVYRAGRALLLQPLNEDSEPQPVAFDKLGGVILKWLQELPDLGTAAAGVPYDSVRLFALTATPETVGRYIEAVIRAVRKLAPTWTDPGNETSPARPSPEYSAGLTGRAYFAARRARFHAEATASARAWITEWLSGDDRPAPGTRISAPELYDNAAETIDRRVTDGAAHADGTPWRTPGKYNFHAVADEILGARKRNKHGYYYVAP